MAEQNEQTTVTRDDEHDRYEIFVGDALGGYTTYLTDTQGRVVFPETQIDPAFKGQGLGTKLVAGAMADAAKRGDTIVPECPFVEHYLRENEVAGLHVDWPESSSA